MNTRTFVKKLIPRKLFKTIEPWGHLAEAVVFNTLYGFPARNMKVVGVTGTNGKTTTSYLIHKMLTEAGYNAGLMTTVAYGVGTNIHPQIHHMTNVGVPEMMRRLRHMKQEKVDWLVLETTSHALAQHRVWGIPYSVVVLTNVTHEHLDYHGSFENYRDAKLQLFKLADKNKKGLRTGVINSEDASADLFAGAIASPIRYGVGEGDLEAKNVQLSADGVQYDVEVAGELVHIHCNIPGSFNVYNSLAAVGVGRTLGLTPKQIEQGIAALDAVEGRMTSIDVGQAASIIVDFAHTPDSFEKLFKDLRPIVKGKLIVMFGSAGRRDEAKRAIQGQLAGKYADELVITEEDDRDCDGIAIMNDIAAGAEATGKVRGGSLFLVHDRSEAIHFAIARATSADDTVLLLGKGHEKTIERANGENDWDEIATARAAARKSVA